jgi:putative transposase
VKDWQPLLSAEVIAILYNEWNRGREKFPVKIQAYVIMPEHVHMMLWAKDAANISAFLRRILGQVSKQIAPGQKGFWKERPRVFPVYSRDIIEEKINYIHRNPVIRGLVKEPDVWKHSSFCQLVEQSEAVPFKCDSFDNLI